MSKSLTPWVVCIVVVLAVIVFEESRVAELKTEIGTLRKEIASPSVSVRETVNVDAIRKMGDAVMPYPWGSGPWGWTSATTTTSGVS